MKNMFKDNGTDPNAQVVLKLDDKYCSLDFGEARLFESDEEARDWLWTYQGKLLVISTPYHHGKHYAKHPSHFLPIIAHLVQLHSHDIVHGDIRAYNMVLQYDDVPCSESDQGAVINTSKTTTTNNDNSEGWLIDFDFGGTLGEVFYPKGYKGLLYDGTRPGTEGEEITIRDDWESLIDVILNKHFFMVTRAGQS